MRNTKANAYTTSQNLLLFGANNFDSPMANRDLTMACTRTAITLRFIAAGDACR